MISILKMNFRAQRSGAHVAEGCTLNWGDGMIDEAPLFTVGVEGGFYLSQTAAGQGENSPCVDAGNESASNITFEGPDGNVCMDELWTRTDEVVDYDEADMGYHYGMLSCPLTPTPFPTATHIPTSPTPTMNPNLAVDLTLSKTTFVPGDLFLLAALISNPGPDTYQNQPFVVLLDAYSIYFWHPTWTETFDYEPLNLDIETIDKEILRFDWPDEPSSGSGIKFYGALLNEEFNDILGLFDMVEFGWAPE